MSRETPTHTAKGTANPVPIEVIGATANNLQELTCAFRRHKITCVCGVSGSGKSSLLFSVLAAESRARHEALVSSGHRKQQAARAPATAVRGLPFGLTVSQRTLHAQKRSTVATQTGIHHDLVSLVKDFGQIRCECGHQISAPSLCDFEKFILQKGGRAEVFSVLFRHGVGGSLSIARAYQKSGARLLKQLDGHHEWLTVPNRGSLDDAIACALFIGETIAGEDGRTELSKALVESAAGVLLRGVANSPSRLSKCPKWTLDTSREWPCPNCWTTHLRATASLLSFNSAAEKSGRCPHCSGLGAVPEVNLSLLIPAPERTVFDGALGLERRAGSFRHLAIREDTVRGVVRRLGASEILPWKRLPLNVQEAILLGTGIREQPLDPKGKKAGAKVIYHGLVPTLRKLIEKAGESGDYARSYAGERMCPICDGSRFDESLVGKYEYTGFSFTRLLSFSVDEARETLSRFAKEEHPPALTAILAQSNHRLKALAHSGLTHLALNRATPSLSGGELQRLKISRSLVGGIVGGCYILDEPSVGLHAADNAGLIENLQALRDTGNTVILADHDPDFIESADERIFLGPGAGRHGGQILKRDVKSERPSRQSKTVARAGLLKLKSCSLHNIKKQDVELPLGQLVCLTGVSGSGKSTFAKGILEPAMRAAITHGRLSGPSWERLSGFEQVHDVIAIGQIVLNRSRRSLVTTYVGVADPIRELLSSTPAAIQRDYRPSTFSCNRSEGWCPTCRGLGTGGEEDNDESTAVCDACGGGRFRDAILDCQWNGKNIAEIFELELADAADFFETIPTIASRLRLLQQLGLGHLKLGRSTDTLSGGEAQRLKLGAKIAEKNGEFAGVLFILDEPTVGLHAHDIQALLDLIDRLLAGGRNTVVVIEHDLSVIRASDHLIDFGPGTADAGGKVVVAGTREEITRCTASLTGAALRGKIPRQVEAATTSHIGVAGQPSIESARSFADFLQEHYWDNQGSAEVQPPQLIRPTYVFHEPDFPPPRTTLLAAFRFIEQLDRCLQPKLHYNPDNPDVRWISSWDFKALATEEFKGSPRLAWTLASDLLSEGRATRSALAVLLKQAKETGATYWTDQTGEMRSVDDDDFRTSNPFHVCVFYEGHSDAANLKHAMQFGSGWVRVMVQSGSNWSVSKHLVARPLSLSRQCLGGRILRTGLMPKRRGSVCPFCNGKGTVTTFPENLAIAHPKLSPADVRFYTLGAQGVLHAVFGRLKKTLEFFSVEGVVDL